MNDKHKHLEFIQQTICRLADNSFRLKQWSVLLVAATLALLSQQSDSTEWACFIPLIPVLVFWGLDGYFLWQERLYRDLYNHVREMEEKEIDFSMNTKPFKTGKQTRRRAIFSETLFLFYGSFALLIIIIAGIILYK